MVSRPEVAPSGRLPEHADRGRARLRRMARAVGGVAREGGLVGWSVPTFGGYHLSPNRTVLSAGANVVQVAGSSTTYFLHSDGTVAVWGPTHTASSGTDPHERAGVCQVDDK